MRKGQYQPFLGILIIIFLAVSVGLMYYFSFKPKIENNQTTTTSPITSATTTTSTTTPTKITSSTSTTSTTTRTGGSSSGGGAGGGNPSSPTTTSSATTLSSTTTVIITTTTTANGAITTSSSTTTTTTTISSGNLIWSCDFESGTQQGVGTYPSSCFNYANDKDIGPGNNPGQVVTTNVHSGNYAGYYYVTGSSNNTDGVTRNFWSIDWTGNQPQTLDFTVEGWFYIPTVTLTDWISLMSIHFDGYSTISVDSQPDRYPILYNQLTPDWGYQNSSNKVQFPFDRWFKLAVEVHYRIPPEKSHFILYMDNVKIVDYTEAARYSTPTNLLALHFGLYNGGNQQPFSVYNDDLKLYDLAT